MNRESVALLLEYNKWANLRILDAASSLNPEQFAAIRDKLAHILFWEEIWLMRWKGNSPEGVPASSELPDLASFQTRWGHYQFDIRNFFSKISDEELQEVIAYDNFEGEEWSYPLWRMMYHTVNHSTSHRGQIITMLRQIGAEFQLLDFLVFLDEGGGSQLPAGRTENPWAP